MLNNDPLDSPIYDKIWEEVRTLQDNGVKVLGLLGGAAAGTYIKLNGTEDKVGQILTVWHDHLLVLV